jgi:hypothetical protein
MRLGKRRKRRKSLDRENEDRTGKLMLIGKQQ